MKIVYVLNDIGSQGGGIKIIIEKANFMAEQFGYDVSIVSWSKCPDKIFYHVSDKVKKVYLDVPYYSQYHYKYPMRLWKKHVLNKNLKDRLNHAVQQIDPDLLICLSVQKADMVSTLKCRAKKIVECHEARFFMTSRIWNQSILTYGINKFYSMLYFRTIEKNADMVVALTDGAKQLWHKAKRVEVIPDFSSMTIKGYSDCKNKRIIAVGRLSKEKGFERLLDIWKIVSQKFPEWQLDIFGDGVLKDTLTKKAESDNIRRVTLHGAQNDISPEYALSSICVVTSYFEGFSLVLLEALMHGVPCVAFDCPFGPRSIIEDGKCGFLIEEGNNALFAEKLCALIENEQLRQHFSEAALERAKHFDIETIMNRWKKLFENLIAE
jgi:glycosyltransferase involved in cell wall biosynthesis